MQDIIISSLPVLFVIAGSLLFRNAGRTFWLRLLPAFLLFTFVVQLGGYYYSERFRKSNHFIFNGYTLISFLFYFFLFYEEMRMRPYRKWLQAGLFVFMATFLLKSFVWGSFFIYNPMVNNVGELLISGCCLCFFYRLLQTDGRMHYFSVPMFWIATGIMFASVGDFVYLSFFNYIMKNRLDPNGVIYGVITTTTSVVEYGLFAVAFIPVSVWKKAK